MPERDMKVLQLGKFYPIRGGVEKVMWDLTRGLCARGVECRMLCAYNEKLSAGDMADDRLILVRAWMKAAATMIAPGMIWKLRKSAKDYDIIHVHHPDPMAALALRLSGYRGKVVLHWHSDILKQQGLLRLYMPLQNWLVRRADLIVGTTPVYVAESPFLKDVQDKVTYLPIGVEGVGFAGAGNVMPGVEAASRGEIAGQARNYGGEDGKKVVFSLGRLVGYKGYRYLVEAAKYLPEDYEIVIGGKGPLHDELQAAADEVNAIEDCASVRLIGSVSDEALPGWFRRCKVFVLSSIWRTEAFAIVQVEAMSFGKPVVATRIPGSGVSWVNEDGVSGINVPAGDARALADAIMKICSDDEVYAGFCGRARRRYEDNFSYDRMIEGCLKLYER